jgi:glutathione S-transferase
MMKILGRKTSSNVQKVLWTCAELGVPFQREDVGGPFGRNRDPEYLALNPNGLVPTVIDDGLVLWESNAIVRYLAARYGEGTLWPKEPGPRAVADKWMDWAQGTLDRAFLAAFLGLVRTPPEKRDHAAIRDSRDKTAAAFAILDRVLAEGDYVGGSRLTIGDIALGPTTYRWHNLDVQREDRPRLRAWYERLAGRPAFREHVMVPIT